MRTETTSPSTVPTAVPSNAHLTATTMVRPAVPTARATTPSRLRPGIRTRVAAASPARLRRRPAHRPGAATGVATAPPGRARVARTTGTAAATRASPTAPGIATSARSTGTAIPVHRPTPTAAPTPT